MADIINTDINDSSGEWGSADTITYDSSNLENIKSDLQSAIDYLKEVKTQIDNMASYDTCWKGNAKDTYEDLKGILVQYQGDFLESVENLQTAVNGLSTLLGNVPNASIIKEISEA